MDMSIGKAGIMFRRGWPILLVLAVAVSACAGPDRREPLGADLPPTPEARLAVLKEDLGALRRVDGSMTMGDADSRYSAYFDGADLRYVEERVGMGDYGSSVAEYLVEGDKLRYYRQESRRVAMEPGAAPGTFRQVEFELWFDAEGNLAGWERTVDGNLTRVPETEIQGALRHWEVLRRDIPEGRALSAAWGNGSAAGAIR